MKAFISAQFSYCPLVWMFHSKKLNHRINSIHERALRIVYNDYASFFHLLLTRDDSVTIHIRNIQTLATELFKMSKGFSPLIMTEVFQLKKSRRYPTQSMFDTHNIHTTHYGIQSLAYLSPKIWDIIPTDLKNINSLDLFKKRIKLWIPNKCPCYLCKTYIHHIGFID